MPVHEAQGYTLKLNGTTEHFNFYQPRVEAIITNRKDTPLLRNDQLESKL